MPIHTRISHSLQILLAGLTALSLSAAPPALAQDDVPPLAVLDFKPKGGVSEDEASIISDRMRTRLFRSGRYQLMERANMLAILKEQGFQQTQDNCDSTSCSVEIGKLLAVNQLMTGSVSKLGSIYTLSYRIVDVERGIVLHDAYRDCRCNLEEVLTNLTGEVLAELTAPQALPTQSPTPVPSVQPQPTATPRPIDFDPALAGRIANIPEADRRAFYQAREKSPAAAALLSAVPLAPTGYIYLDDWNKFWTMTALEVGFLALPFVTYPIMGYTASYTTVPIGFIGAAIVYGYGIVDSLLLADAKNQELRQKLQLADEAGLSWRSAQAWSTQPLLKWQVSF